MQIEAPDILSYHCPRWDELPEIDLYIDQVVTILQNNLSIFDEKGPVITQSMINNYVKQHVLKRPVKKKYARSHLAYLFVICIFKKILSISEIREAIVIMQKVYSVEEGYNLFCDELENALKHYFDKKLSPEHVFSEDDIKEVARLKAILASFASTVLVDRLMKP